MLIQDFLLATASNPVTEPALTDAPGLFERLDTCSESEKLGQAVKL
jgi:hypothetical protein